MAVAIIWGVAVGIWNTPAGPRIDLEAHSKEMLVPIDIQGKSENLVVKIDPSQVNLKISGKAEQLAKLKPEEIRVYIELEDTATGEQHLPVGVSLPPNVQMRDVVPRLVNVKIIKLR